MELDEFVVVTMRPEEGPRLFYQPTWEKDQKYYWDEYPELVVVRADTYENEDDLADAIIQMIGEELESENRHSINGIQDDIYLSLIKNGVSKMVAASAIYEGFGNL